MRSLTLVQFLKIFGMTSGAFDAQQRAGHVALAFGTPIPATAGRPFKPENPGRPPGSKNKITQFGVKEVYPR